MSVDDRPLSRVAVAPPAPRVRPRDARPRNDIEKAARDLLDGLIEWPWGQVSPSVYETGRLVTLAPWLRGHGRRVSFLLEQQRADGAWGAPDDGYALVPTLSAAEALLSALTDPGGTFRDLLGSEIAAGWLVRSADRALRALSRRMCGPSAPPLDLPDLPAIDVIAPALIERINASLDGLREHPVPGLDAWAGVRLSPPAGMATGRLELVRAMAGSGMELPEKLMHALEVLGQPAAGLLPLSPESTGTIGASPAAAAAWLGARGPDEPGDPVRWYLETVVARHGGPVPCGYPLTVFERGWVLAWLARAGIRFGVRPELVLSLTAPLGRSGTAAADGLPADADTTSGALYALALLGAPRRPDPLYAYELDTHFCTWQGEDGASVTTNAHVLEAFGEYLATGLDRTGGGAAPGADAAGRGAAAIERYRGTVAKVARWLRGQQRPDGSWTDRWHASPHYATASTAIALAKFGGAESAAAVGAARAWTLETQRPDGSWGRWAGTPEETAYAVQLLLLTDETPDAVAAHAVSRARPHLLESLTSGDAGAAGEPALWHDKDLYRPAAIVRAAVLAALHLDRANPTHR
ncbi:prenyltransferase/squalene oxidase repeat-containing protein [Actinomadura fibrosa]|uniref:Prenyltransferase/squalene oxidase repeat-containing protein n=1 Tax=Actinomadura fibrosa TaxID=111802 RepID=A0ABW2XMQ3_9ACTN|nr:prenyltransferase/squalene oxidase repeat-containing protein [Actinomadura fibrosa]